MNKKEFTKMICAAMDNGTLYGMAVATLVVGGISFVLGGGLFGLFIHNAKQFNRDYPDWDIGIDERRED